MGSTYIIFHTIGGLGLFIFGMRMMSDGLQHVAGDRLRKILETVSANRIVACITGTVLTALIQSSSATTVMLVGFVNAGLMSLTQAIGVALGANIGTTVTAQLIAFNIADAALPAIALGVAVRLFAQRRKAREIGGVVLGFGLLFFGMTVMKMGVGPLKNSPIIVDFFTRFDATNLHGILFCVLIGTVVTMVLQSSSATVGLTMTLASQGLIGLPGAIALVLGDNIGTTITAELASIGSGVAAKRTARAHTMFNVLGVCYMVILFPLFISSVTWVTQTFMGTGAPELVLNGEHPNIARYIANAHTLFNLVNASFFLLILPLLVRLASALTFTKEQELDHDIFKPQYLDTQFIDMTPVALRQARQEIIRMGGIAQDMMAGVIASLDHRQLRTLNQWKPKEQALDALQRHITDFLIQVSQRDTTLEESREVSQLLRMVNNVERIGDSVENLGELIEEMVENDIYLSMEGVQDYHELATKVTEFYDYLLDCMKTGKKHVMDESRTYEEAIDLMHDVMRDKHISRLRAGTCTIDPGLVFTDMLSHFEKIGDYCFNVAQALAGVK